MERQTGMQWMGHGTRATINMTIYLTNTCLVTFIIIIVSYGVRDAICGGGRK